LKIETEVDDSKIKEEKTQISDNIKSFTLKTDDLNNSNEIAEQVDQRRFNVFNEDMPFN
jgi:hypothetical protein